MRLRAVGFSLLVLLAFPALPACAQVSVQDAWVRATVPQQKATGAFMSLRSARDARLVEARSPAAGLVELHEMTLANNVMKMRAIPALELPAGKSVELRPGGHHLMLMDLKSPVKEGSSVPITLVIEGRDGKRETIEVKAAVRALTDAGHGHGKHAGH